MARDHEGIAEEGELFQTHIGGSALTEGVMMRGRLNWAVAVREPSGRIYTEEHDLPERPRFARLCKLPIFRGCFAFVSSVALSGKAMAIAAEHALGEAGEPAGEDASASASDDAAPEPLSSTELGLSLVVGVVLGLALFVALPVGVANLLVGDYTSQNAIAWNLVEALLRVVILVAYIWGIGRVPDMARVFGYHGAEHQTIHCFEHGAPLTPEACARYSRLHVRCGTAFLIMTVLVAIVVNTVVPVALAADALGLAGIGRAGFVFLSRLVMLPLVAGLSYEVTVRWAGSHPESPLVRVVLWPGMQMQRLTTRVPDEGMLECAIAALKLVRDREQLAGLAPDEGGCCGEAATAPIPEPASARER